MNHTRMRKLLSHAFSDSALREQESILTGYFDLLVSRLKEQCQNPQIDKVDIISWYNFTLFDIIGFVSRHALYYWVHYQISIHTVKEHTHKGRSDLTLGDSFHSLENSQLHSWIRYSAHNLPVFKFTKCRRNVFASIKIMCVMRTAATYPIINRVFEFLMSNIPLMAHKQKAHYAFVKQKTESRLNQHTDRKDFITYVSCIESLILFLTHVFCCL